MTAKKPRGYYSTQEAARAMHVSLRTVQLWVDSGKLSATVTAGGHRRILKSEVDRMHQMMLITQVHVPTLLRLLLDFAQEAEVLLPDLELALRLGRVHHAPLDARAMRATLTALAQVNGVPDAPDVVARVRQRLETMLQTAEAIHA